MVRINKVYTKTGDKGETSLGDGNRVDKDSALIAAIGDVDELNSSLGLARSELSENNNDALKGLLEVIARIQNDLFDVGADLCCPRDGKKAENRLRISDEYINQLEVEIDKLNNHINPLRSFILPGGTRLAAYLHLSRSISRRAERSVIHALRVSGDLAEGYNKTAIYLNRLSDFLFVAARFANNNGETDILWKPGKSVSS